MDKISITPENFCFKTKPFQHQQHCFSQTCRMPVAALLMEQGTGKTKVAIDTAAYLYLLGQINTLIVVAPNGVHRNWVLREIPTHLPESTNAVSVILEPSNSTKKYKEIYENVINNKGLKVFAINVEAFGSSDKAEKIILNILKNNKCFMVIDESSRIKSPKAKRTKVLCDLGKYARYKRILTGTPVTQGPQDIYTQFKFLSPDILGYKSYTAFKAKYVITEQAVTASGQRYEKIKGYQNLKDLENKIKPFSFRVTKDECLDLPEKIYKRVIVQLSKEQQKAYNDFKEEMITEINGEFVTASIVLTKLLRGQQILGGFLPLEDRMHVFEDNNRLDMLVNICEESQGKVIIWARFRQEIDLIVNELKSNFGPLSVVEYHGRVCTEDRDTALDTFQNNKDVRYFVGNSRAGGIGLTLTQASTVIYYSNDFSLETRLQSEDRAHRIGQKNKVLYIDFEAENTIDTKIIDALLDKKNIADIITGDGIRKWF